MLPQQKIFKAGALISIGVMALLLLGAIIFWKERMLLCDASHIAFEIINTGTLQIQQLRYGSFITQIVPLTASKMHLPLQAVLMLYSVSFNLFYLIVISLLVFRLRQYKLAILMAFYYTLVSSDSFYWTNNEVYQGIAWMFLFFAAFVSWGQNRKRKLAIVWLIVLAALALTTHPLVSVAFVYLYIFLWLEKGDWPFSKKESIEFGLVFLLLVIAKLGLSKTVSKYDAEMFPELSELNPLKALSTEMAYQLVKHAVKNYWIVPVLFIWGAVTAARQKKYLILTLTVISCLFYFILISASFKGYLAFYTESELMPGIILATAPFIYLTLPNLKYRTGLVLLVSIFIIRLLYIGISSEKFTNRIAFLDSILSEMEKRNISKLTIVKDENAVDIRLMLDWATPSESIVLSALNGDKPQKNFIIVQIDKTQDILAIPSTSIISNNRSWTNNQLNSHYFNIDTLQQYNVVSFDAFKNSQ